MPKPPKDDEAEDTQIFDSNKYPILKRPGAAGVAPPVRPSPPNKVAAPSRPTPGTRPPPIKELEPEPPQPTRVVVMQVPSEAIPPARPRDKRDSQVGGMRDSGLARDNGRREGSSPNLVRRSKPPSNISYPADQGPDAGVPVGTPNVVPRPVAPSSNGNFGTDTERVPRIAQIPAVEQPATRATPAPRPTPLPRPTPSTRAMPSQLPPSANTVIAEFDAGVTSPDLKVPVDLRSALDSNPDLRAMYDSSPGMQVFDAGPTNIVRVRQDTPPTDHNETNPLAVPIQAMAAHRSTAPMPIPEHTKIGVVERPAAPRQNMSAAQAAVLPAMPAAPFVPSAEPGTDPLAKLDAERVRRIPNRVRHITPTAMSSMPDIAAALASTVAAPPIRDDDDDNFNETRERRIDRDALRALPQAAALMGFNDAAKKRTTEDKQADKLHPTPVVLSGPAQSRALPVMSAADSGTSTNPKKGRPTAPSRGGLVWVWMVLAALAIAAAVAAAMWYLAS